MQRMTRRSLLLSWWRLISAVALLAVLALLAVRPASAASLTVAPNPVVIHIAPAFTANPANLVALTVTANGFAPNGRAIVLMGGSFRAAPMYCNLVSATTVCLMSPAPVGPGTYFVRVRYFPSGAGAGPILAVDVPVIVTP